MKKEIITIFFIILIVFLVTIAIFYIHKSYFNIGNAKLIYSSYYKTDGFIIEEQLIEIYDNGIIVKSERIEKEETKAYKRIGEEELKTLKDLIIQVENNDLNKENNSFETLIGQYNEYINLNKKIILKENGTAVTNSFVEELHIKINNIVNKKFK